MRARPGGGGTGRVSICSGFFDKAEGLLRKELKRDAIDSFDNSFLNGEVGFKITDSHKIIFSSSDHGASTWIYALRYQRQAAPGYCRSASLYCMGIKTAPWSRRGEVGRLSRDRREGGAMGKVQPCRSPRGGAGCRGAEDF